jgi:ABC-type nitrate/sulfonate/bicarbonate transport system substrate-binding protein
VGSQFEDSNVNKRNVLVGVVFALFVAASLIAIRGSVRAGPRRTTPKSPPAASRLRKLSVRLGWQVNANSAGQIVALERGFYREQGLDVDLLPGGLSDPSVKTVAAGADQIGFANSPNLVISARAAGAPLRIVAVIQQEGYHGFMARAGSGIEAPKDWEGRRVGVKYASPTFLYYQGLLQACGVDRDSIEEVPLQYGLQPFLEGHIDVYPGALTNEAITLEMAGLSLKCIRPGDYGIASMGNVVFTSEQFLAAEPQTVRRFLAATLRGWRRCLDPENEAEALEYMRRHSPALDAEKEGRALAENRRLVLSGTPGRIDEERLASIIAQMGRADLLKHVVAVADVVAHGYLPGKDGT